MKLTQKTIAGIVLPAGKREHIVFDEDLPGFGLRIRDTGARSWVYMCKFGRRNRRMTLGSVTAVSPADARATAKQMHAQARLGQDPGQAKIDARTQASMAETLRSYLAYQRSNLKWRSYVECERHLLKNCKALHALPLAKIDRRIVASRIAAVSKRGAVTANRTRASLSAFFSWAMREGLADTNPVIGTNKQPERSRARVLDDAELKIIWQALDADNSDYSAIVKLLLLTAQRANEIAALRWSEIAGDQIKLPAARTKNSREHTIPLSSAAQSILAARPRGDDEFVFGRRQGRPFRGWGVCKAALDQRIAASGAKLAAWTHHDLRRTAVTRMAELGMAPPHIIEAVVNHVSGHKSGIAGTYNLATYEPQKKIALQAWCDYLVAVVTGEKSEKVVSLRTAGKSTQ